MAKDRKIQIAVLVLLVILIFVWLYPALRGDRPTVVDGQVPVPNLPGTFEKIKTH
jgi:hypothetical protein